MVALYRNYPLNVFCKTFNQEMYDWFEARSANIVKNNNKNQTFRNEFSAHSISLNGAKPVYFGQDGSVKINFTMDDINDAAMFLLQFDEFVLNHTIDDVIHLQKGISRERL